MRSMLRGLVSAVKLLLIAFAFVVMVFTLLSVTGFNKEKSLLGYRFFIVLSESMSDQFTVGDVTVSKEIGTEALNEGDIITFKTIDPTNYGAVITHKIREKAEYNGRLAFVTYGTRTGISDLMPAFADNVLGRYQFKIPRAGYVFDFLRSPQGYVTLILLPFFGIFLLEGIRFSSLFKLYRKEKIVEGIGQIDALAEERKKSEEMAKEIAELRKALEASSGSLPPIEPNTNEFVEEEGHESN